MKIRITFEVDSLTRRAINFHYGLDGAASHSEIKETIEAVVAGDLESMVLDYENSLEEDK